MQTLQTLFTKHWIFVVSIRKKKKRKKSPKHWMNLFSHSIGIHKHPEAARLTCSAPNSISKRHF